MANIILHDIWCRDCNNIKLDEAYDRDEVPSCECGKPMSVYWAGPKRERKADNFCPLTYEDVHYNTKEEWQGKLKSIEANVGERVEVVSDSKSLRNQRAETAWQAGYEKRKSLGVDSHDQAREYGEHIKDYNRGRKA